MTAKAVLYYTQGAEFDLLESFEESFVSKLTLVEVAALPKNAPVGLEILAYTDQTQYKIVHGADYT